jgi:hypothetical protein
MSKIAGFRQCVSLAVVALALGAAPQLASPAHAQDVGYIGIPEHPSTATGIPFFFSGNAKAVDDAYREMAAAIAACNSNAYYVALGKIAGAIQSMQVVLVGVPPLVATQRARDAQLMQEAATRRPLYPNPCPPVVAPPPVTAETQLQTAARRLEAEATMPSAETRITGMAGFPTAQVPGSAMSIYREDAARRAGEILARAKAAAARCDAAELAKAMNEWATLIRGFRANSVEGTYTEEAAAQNVVTADILSRIYQEEFPKGLANCPPPQTGAAPPVASPSTAPVTTPTTPSTAPPASGQPPETPAPKPATDDRHGMAPRTYFGLPAFEVALVASGVHPMSRGFNVTGFDSLAGAGAVDVRGGGASYPYYLLGLRARLYNYMLMDAFFGQSSLFPGWAVFAELGFEFGMGRSHQQSFQGVNGVPQGFGEQTFQNLWAVAFRMGFSFPLGRSPFATRMARSEASLWEDGTYRAEACYGESTCASDAAANVMFDLYGGLVINNSRHVLRGNEAGAGAGANGYYAEAFRSTMDPTIGMGIRIPFAAGGMDMFVGGNVEATLRQGSVVRAPSLNFASQTYFGTIDPGVDLAISARIGVRF